MIYTELTKKALAFCYEAHAGQYDKVGLPYVFHPLHLAEEMTDEASTVVALLHDVMEDTHYTREDLEAMGFGGEIMEALLLLTHDPSVPYMDYVAALKSNPIARAVKLADLRHNSDLSRMSPHQIDQRALDRQAKYLAAIEFLLSQETIDNSKKIMYNDTQISTSKGSENQMTIYEELVARGLIAQVTNEDEIKEMINNGKATFYIGFDPTADSLHVGHFMALCLMKRLQMAGNRPVVLIGGGTAMIGDPSGRTDMRSMMTKETIQHNCDCFKKQMERFIEFGEDKAIMVNNADWLLDLNYVEVLREVGACFSVNNMLRAECYKQRMEKGLSFLEFNYMIMQSYDFYYLFQKYGCNMQFGGNDQWSNMLGGTELIRRKLGKDAHAMTITLLLNSEGKKMGKTASGAVWLDPVKTTPYDFYQYWRNVDDADVLKCIRMLTFLPIEQIQAMDSWEGSQLNEAKDILAYELTKLVHGEEEAEKARTAAKSLFGGGDGANAPILTLTAEDFYMDGKVDVPTMLVRAGFAKSKSEARQAIQQGGVTLDGEKITDPRTTFAPDYFGEGKMLRKGKKNFVKVVVG